MNSADYYKNFIFLDINFSNYHYTDNRSGVTRNYIAYMKKGRARIVTRDDSFEILEGDVFFIPKNCSYQSYWYGDNEISFLSLGFGESLTDDNLKFKAQIVNCDEQTKKLFFKIEANGSRVSSKSLSAFYDVLSRISGLLEGSFETSNKIKLDKVKAFIQKEPNLSLGEVAEKCGISTPYLYLLFKNNEEVTPNEFKQRVLCQRAAELLTVTDKSVEEISSALGFSSSSYFRKILKKHLGQTPREIRNTPRF